jgi:hypothetical protein
MNTRNNPKEDLVRDALRDEAIIAYQKREEVEAACREHDEKHTRKPAKIVVERHDKVQADTLPF